MKKKLVIALTLMLTIFSLNIKASEDDPAYLITDEYIIIEHVKYDLVDNKIKYMGLDFELEDSVLVAYDAEGVPNILVLPVEQNRIKDEETIRELNSQVGISANKTRAIPTYTVNLPYSKTLSNSQWSDTTPAININVPGKTEIPYTYLSVSGLAWNANKHFSVGHTTGDFAGNWYSQPFKNDHNFGAVNKLIFINTTATRYAIYTLGNLGGETGYTYSFTK